MESQVFSAPDMARAMAKVREALGADAVILSTTQSPDGGVEIEAASEAPERAPAAVAAAAAATASGGPSNNAAIAALCRRVDSLSELVGRHLMHSEAFCEFGARPEVAPWYQILSRQEVDPIIMADLFDGLAAEEGPALGERLFLRLKKLFKVSPPLQKRQKGPHVWFLVGPTGVGKTTTVAKLAADFSLKKRLKVGMVSTDGYRMAAGEQLKAFGRIMELPTISAATPAQMIAALDSLADRDLILVDTPGHAPEDGERAAETARLLEAVPAAGSHLLLACPTRDADQRNAAEHFARFQPVSLMFTKLDETGIYGPMLNQVVRNGLPVSFLSTGQRVPEDLEAASRFALAVRVLPEAAPEAE